MKDIFFFIGTEAELIKVFPVMMKCQELGGICHIIASGQNDLKKSRIIQFLNLTGTFIELSQEADIKKSAVGLFNWFIKTKNRSLQIIRHSFKEVELKGAPLVVHGDTVSTFMGAMVGNALKMKVCHIEAGLRSHNFFNPFPEEIDRILTSRLARIHFAPGKEAVFNLRKVKGQVIDTHYNTILDSLLVSEKMPIVTTAIETIIKQDYFVFVMHRQENLMNKNFVEQVIEKIEVLSKAKKCVFILHEITRNTLVDTGMLNKLNEDPNFILLPRVDYFDFMKLLRNSKFVITDGGSNQEELYYMGKPTLIMRKTTERNEGIGQNAVMYEDNLDNILAFGKVFDSYKIQSIVAEASPSKVIAEKLVRC